MKFIVSSDYLPHETYIRSLPQLMEQGLGQVLHRGRNDIRLFEHEGKGYVVKRFQKMNWVKRFVYTHCRENKALRSYENAQQLLRMDIATPQPIAYMAYSRWGLLCDIYYVCGYNDARPLVEKISEAEQFDRSLTHDFALFVADLHDRGIIHHDLNNTNVTWHEGDAGREFVLIDVNRMTFCQGTAPLDEALKNLTLFCHDTPQFRYFLDTYIQARRLDEATKQRALAVKTAHDLHWERKQRLKARWRGKKR